MPRSPAREGRPGRAAADDHPGRRADHRHRDHGAGAGRRRASEPGATSPPGSGSRRCRSRPAASRSSAPISKMGERTLRRLLIHRGQRGDPAGLPAWRAGRVMAGSDAGPQAEDAGHRGPGQQDGPHRLGAAWSKAAFTELRPRRRKLSRPRGRRGVGGRRRVWRNSRRDGVGKTRAFHSASSTLWVIWTRSANSHTGQRQTHRRIRGRTDGSIRLRATTILKFSLALKGASTDGKRPSGSRGSSSITGLSIVSLIARHA